MNNIRYALVVVGLWLARLGGWTPDPPCALPHLTSDYADTARLAVREAEKLGGSGEYRRREALRVMLNLNPGARERDLAMAIELAVREAP